MMMGEAEIELYLGNDAQAYARVERDTAAFEKSRLETSQLIRAGAASLRGRCAVASAQADPGLCSIRLEEARKLAAKIDKENMGWTALLATILRAGVASVQGDRSRAAGLLRSAIDLSERADMFGHAHAARYQLGLLVGGAEGDALVRQAEDAMATQGVRVPARFAYMLVPGRWRADSSGERAVPRATA